MKADILFLTLLIGIQTDLLQSTKIDSNASIQQWVGNINFIKMINKTTRTMIDSHNYHENATSIEGILNNNSTTSENTIFTVNKDQANVNNSYVHGMVNNNINSLPTNSTYIKGIKIIKPNNEEDIRNYTKTNLQSIPIVNPKINRTTFEAAEYFKDKIELQNKGSRYTGKKKRSCQPENGIIKNVVSGVRGLFNSVLSFSKSNNRNDLGKRKDMFVDNDTFINKPENLSNSPKTESMYLDSQAIKDEGNTLEHLNEIKSNKADLNHYIDEIDEAELYGKEVDENIVAMRILLDSTLTPILQNSEYNQPKPSNKNRNDPFGQIFHILNSSKYKNKLMEEGNLSTTLSNENNNIGNVFNTNNINFVDKDLIINTLLNSNPRLIKNGEQRSKFVKPTEVKYKISDIETKKYLYSGGDTKNNYIDQQIKESKVKIKIQVYLD